MEETPQRRDGKIIEELTSEAEKNLEGEAAPL